MTPSAKTATGIGSGVTLAWIWNAVLPAAMGLWTSVEGWPMMPAEVAAALGPTAMALLDQFVSDT